MPVKAPSELRKVPFLMAQKVPANVAIVSGLGYASRKVTGFSTTLQAGTSISAPTLPLNANPGVGALLTVDPGAAGEEKFKVVSIAGSAPWVATLSHTAEYDHAISAVVNYEPGMTSRFLVTPTATIVGTQAFLNVQFGADGSTYRTTVLCPLDNGEDIELEQDIVVTELLSAATKTIQVDEERFVSLDFSADVDLQGSALASATAWVCREETMSTTLNGAINTIGQATINLHANPGAGALLTLNPTGNNQERLKVTSVSGVSDPFICTVNSTPDFTHSDGETVSFLPGVTSRILTSSTATILGTEAIFMKRLGVAGRNYRLMVLATLADGQKIFYVGTLAITET